MFSHAQLLAQKAANYLASIQAVMTVGDYLDIAFMAVLLSTGFVWLRRRGGRAIMYVLIGMLVTYSTAKQLKMPMTSALFQFGLMAVFMSIVVIFQEDFRRIFESLATWRPWGTGRPIPGAKVADAIVECAQILSDHKIGALIAIQGRQPVDSHSRQGIVLHGKISVPLLQSIFDPNSPGHDGGVVIAEGKISQFGAHFPLSREGQATGRLGTRHAAALGLAEKCDALVVVVSEETGTISIAHDGKFRSPSTNELRKLIISHFRRTGTGAVHRTFLEIPWLRLITSVPLAMLLWFAYARPINLIVRSIEATIVYKNLPKGLEAKAPEPAKVQLTLFGPEGPLMQLEPTKLSLPVDLTKLRAGETQYVLGDSGLSLPPRVVVKRIEPPDITVQAYQTIDLKLPVKMAWLRTKDRRVNSLPIHLETAQVSIRVPKLALQPQFIETDPIDFGELVKNGRLKVKLRTPANIPSAELNPKEVEVTYGDK